MSSPRDRRAQADAILGNTPQRPDSEAFREAGQRISNTARSGFNTARAAGKHIADTAAVELAITQGQPPFPHTLHTFLTIITAGLWGPIYYLRWLTSARRRYQRARRAQLRANGIDC